MVPESKITPKISIIIACYNDIDVVVAVKSAYHQTYPNKEIIVVDDGSNQQTQTAIQSVREFIDVVITQNNQGQSIARNNGIKKATGKYILNLDSDDYFEPEFCDKAVKKFQQHSDTKIVTCYARRFSKSGEIDIFSPLGGYLQNFLFSNSALGSSMFKKADWETCGGYEENLPILGFEDWEFYLNVLKTGGVAHVLPEVLFNYQVRENSTSAKIKYFKQDKFKHIILKHSELYKENFEGMVTNLFDRVKTEEIEKNRNEKSIDFRLGSAILRPFRFIKSLRLK